MVTQIMLRKFGGKQEFSEMNFRFATALDLKKCFEQIKLLISHPTCAQKSELPTNIRSMGHAKKAQIIMLIFLYNIFLYFDDVGS